MTDGTSGGSVRSSEGSEGWEEGEQSDCHGPSWRTSAGPGSVAGRSSVGNMRSVGRSPDQAEIQQNRSKDHSAPALS